MQLSFNQLLVRIFSVLTLLLIAGCGPMTVSQITEQKNAKQLTSDELVELVEANTLFFHSGNEDTYFYFDGSGRVFGLDVFNNRDTGLWDITESGEMCMRMHTWWYGDLRCFPAYAGKDRIYLVNSTGVIEFRAEQFTGDYKNQFYDEKADGKKISRRSARTKPVKQSAAGQSGPDGDDQPEQSVTEEQYVPPLSDTELRSTVKWMARDCPGCNLANADLHKADLVGARLQGAGLAGADLSMANLRRAELQGANLEHADLSYANLPGADLRNAVLTNADLRGANLIRADLSGADIRGANFEGALLEGTVGLDD